MQDADADTPNEQLITELKALRRRVAELERDKGASTDPAELRRRAEEWPKAKMTETAQRETNDTERLYRGLAAHQIELEMQNDELRNTLAQIEESRTWYSDLYDFAPVGYLTLDENGLVLEANVTIAQRLGVERSYLVSRPLPAYIVSADRDAFRSHLGNVLKDKTQQTCEVRFMKGSGGEFHALLDTIFMLDVVGGRRIRTSVTDITERKRGEAALAESEQRFKLLYEQIPIAYQSLDENGDLIEVNPAWLKALGFMKEEVIGRNFADFLRPDWVNHFKENFLRFKAVGEVLGVEFEMVKKDGSMMLVSFHGKIVRDSEGRFKQTHCIFQNITEQRLAEERLRESEQRFRSLFERSRAAMLVVEPDSGAILDVNEAATEFYGFSKTALCAMNITQINQLPSEVVAEARQSILKLKTNSFVFPHRLRSGEIRTVEVYSSPIEMDGRMVLFSIVHDITERKRMVEELRESEAQLRQIIDLVPHMIFVKDWDGKYLLVNKAVAEGYNMSVSDLTGRYHADFHPDDSELRNMLQDDREVMATGETKSIPEEPYTDAKGNLRFLQTTKVPFNIFGAKTPAVLGVAIDITKNKQTKESLRESEARLDLALRSAHMGVWRLDLIENKRHFDDQVCHLLGIDPAKFTGTAEEFYKAVHPGDRETLTAALARSIEQDVLYETEYRTVLPDGSVHHIRARGKLYRDEAGRPIEINGVVWDITEAKRAEEEREKLEAQLSRAQKLEAVGTLAGGIAHDFNNILQPIIGYTEMALNELSPSSPVRDGLDQVVNASLRARELVRQILAISRSTHEQQRIPTDISSIVKEALKLLRSTLPTSVEIRQDIRMGVALADPTQIHQVLMNLCTNAAHAMDDKGILEVRLSPVDLSESDLADQLIIDLKPGLYLRLTVSDTGCGMDVKTMERIFDPYFTTKEVGKGSGLGLAVINGIVKRHEGTITVRSEPGKGTTFSIYIPRVDVQPEVTMQVDDPLQRGSERILLVDDEPVVAAMGTNLLERLGYKVTSQTDSVIALEVLRLSPDDFDLVITDYTMPKLTGLDLAREVLRIRPNKPILLCTGFSEKITTDSVKELGVELLMKPYGMRQISEAVRKILDARKGG